MDELFNKEIADRIKYLNSQEDYDLVLKTYQFAYEKHKGQKRDSGEDYIIHPIEVVKIMTTLEVSPETLCAGFLHDIVEDCGVSIDEIKERFGEQVAYLVDSLTKINSLPAATVEEMDNLNYRKIFIAMAKDIRVIIVKLADRLHNMRTLEYKPKDRQIKIAQATLDIYAPIAHRLGLFNIKSELENLSLKFLEPEKYEYIVNRLNATERERQASVDKMINKLHQLLRENNMDFEIYGRAKQVYSIYRKLERGKDWDELYDLLALSVITDTEVQCYEVLGYIHATYKPIPGRFKDYIAVPKPNMYQALHTTIINDDGYIYEIQIKTKHMREVAESGVAAHWKYKEGKSGGNRYVQNEIEEKLHWFRDFVSITDEEKDTKEYIENLKKDIFEADIYVLTPKGLVIDLPKGATPIDFAYKVHSAVGDSAVGAIVNGHLVPLSKELNTGDIVEIKTSKIHTFPSEGWLEFVKTNNAKSRIKKALQRKMMQESRADVILRGKEMLYEELKERNINEKNANKIIESEKIIENNGFSNSDDFYIAIANKTISAITLAQKIKQKFDGETEPEFKSIKKKDSTYKNKYGVSINGETSLMVTLSQCCCPIPGDEIIGYVSKGKGIKIHRKDCPTIAKEKKRLIEASWTKEAYESQSNPVDIMIECNDRPNLLIDIMNTLSQNKITVQEISATAHKETMTASIYASLLVKDAQHLREICNVLANVQSVYEIKRITRN